MQDKMYVKNTTLLHKEFHLLEKNIIRGLIKEAGQEFPNMIMLKKSFYGLWVSVPGSFEFVASIPGFAVPSYDEL